MTRATDELQSIISEVEALQAKLAVWERAGRFITDAGGGLDDLLGNWLGEAERELEGCRLDAAAAERRRIQSIASRGAE